MALVDQVPGRSASVPRVPGAPPSTSTAAVPSGHRTTVQPVMPDEVGPVTHAHARDIRDHVTSFFGARFLVGRLIAPSCAGLAARLRTRLGRRSTTREHRRANTGFVVHLGRRSSIAMCPACSITTSVASGSIADERDGGRRRRHPVVLPTITIAGTATRGSAWRRSISISPASPSVHTSGRAVRRARRRDRRDGAAPPDRTASCGRSARHVGGAREHGRAAAGPPAGGRPERPEPRTQQLGHRAHRPAEQIGGRRADQHHAGDAVPNSSGCGSAIARIAIAPMLCPTTTAGPVGRRPRRGRRRCRGPSRAPTGRRRRRAPLPPCDRDPTTRIGTRRPGRSIGRARPSCRG